MRLFVPVTIALFVFAALPNVAAADHWDREKGYVENYHKEIVKIIKDRKSDDSSVRRIRDNLRGIQSVLDRNANGYLRKNNMDEEAKWAKKYYELAREFDRNTMQRYYLQFLEDFEEWKERVTKFRKAVDKNQEEMIEFLEKVNDQTKRAYGRIRDGRMSPTPLLVNLRGFREKSLPSIVKGLDEMSENADKLFGWNARELDKLEDLLDRARNGKGGNDPMDELVKVTKDSAERWKSDLEKIVGNLNKEYRDLLGGSKEHRPFNEELKELASQEKEFRSLCSSDKGFAYEGKALTEEMEELAEDIGKEGVFRQRDIDEFDEQLDEIVDTAKEFRFNPPRWVQDSQRILETLKGRDREMQKMRDESTDLARKLRDFNKEIDSECASLVRELGAADDLEAFIAAKEEVDDAESEAEDALDSILREIEEVADLAESLAEIPERRGVGDVIVAAIHNVVERVKATLDEIRMSIERDDEVEAMVEGYDGR
jgi:uncharacterized phage infection (PIP) family protein YhgE